MFLFIEITNISSGAFDVLGLNVFLYNVLWVLCVILILKAEYIEKMCICDTTLGYYTSHPFSLYIPHFLQVHNHATLLCHVPNRKEKCSAK